MQMIWAETALLPTGWANKVLVEIDGQGRIGGVQVQHAAASSTRGMTTARNDESSIVPYLSFLCFVFRVQGVKTSRGRGSIGSCSGSR